MKAFVLLGALAGAVGHDGTRAIEIPSWLWLPVFAMILVGIVRGPRGGVR